MDRRGFLKVALGVAGAAAALASLPADAMPVAPMPQTGAKPGEAPAAAIATPEDMADAKVENVYWGWRRRRWRRWGYRRWGYRPWRRRYWGWRRRRWWW
jgi:TAT (twin-arginine translocation) pathway signal sequence